MEKQGCEYYLYSINIVFEIHKIYNNKESLQFIRLLVNFDCSILKIFGIDSVPFGMNTDKGSTGSR